MRLSNKIAIVTGAGSGFGEGIARTFAREGASRRQRSGRGKGRQVADLDKRGWPGVSPGAALFFAADVTDDKAVAAMVRTEERFGGLDIMVNNAGYTHRNKPMLEVTDAEFDRIFAVNVKALFLAAAMRSGAGTARRRRHPDDGIHGGAAAASGPDLVQQLQGRRDHRDQEHGGGTRPAEDPRQRYAR